MEIGSPARFFCQPISIYRNHRDAILCPRGFRTHGNYRAIASVAVFCLAGGARALQGSVMLESVAIIGAGVSGLTCGVVFAERGYCTAIFAKEVAQQTTSGAAAAVWFPYDAEPADKVFPWALATYEALVDLSRDPSAGVSMIELRQFSRTKEIQIPDWAIPLGAQPSSRLPCHRERPPRRSAAKAGSRDISQIIQERLLSECSADGHNDLSRLPRESF